MNRHFSDLQAVGIFSLLLAFGILAVVGCGTNANSAFDTVGFSIGKTVSGGGPYVAGDSEGRTGATREVMLRESPVAVAALPRREADATATRERPGEEALPDKPGSVRLKAGTLTGGSFDDTAHFAAFASFLKKVGCYPEVGKLSQRFTSEPLVVTVRDKDDVPVGNARVRIAPAKGGPAVELISRTDGRVVFVNSWDQIADAEQYAITVAPGGNAQPVEKTVARGTTSCTVTLPRAGPGLPGNLDLVLLVDTTGSMGDELEYLKVELKKIVATIHERFPKVKQRYGLILYRDMGDEYVTRTFGFTESLDELHKNLTAQSAGGGGDTPEAVHEGLEQALELLWRGGNTARVLFHVADAPPHVQLMERSLNAVQGLRKKGVAIYPVACSGYDPPCEFIMRSAAMLTGGEFLFLTDDSGVGNAHAEPHIPFYQVQRLDQLMIRVIAGELSGHKVQPKAQEIIRTVGQPPNAAGK